MAKAKAKAKASKSRNGWYTLANGLHIWGNGASKAGKGKNNPLSKLVKNSKNSDYTSTGKLKKNAHSRTSLDKLNSATVSNVKARGARITKAGTVHKSDVHKLVGVPKVTGSSYRKLANRNAQKKTAPKKTAPKKTAPKKGNK